MIEGDAIETIEENRFAFSMNLSARVERQRDFMGVEGTNMMRMVVQAATVCKAKLGGPCLKKSNAAIVHDWLVRNVKWGLRHCPEVQTVQRLLDNWNLVQKHPRVVQLMEASVQQWGRDNLLDGPTKIAIILQKTDEHTVVYATEALYCHMWRHNNADPYSVADLQEGDYRYIVESILC